MADDLNTVTDWQNDKAHISTADLPAYLEIIKDLPGSKAQKIDLIQVISVIQLTIIRSHLGLDPVSLALEQQLVDKFKRKAASNLPKMVNWTNSQPERED